MRARSTGVAPAPGSEARRRASAAARKAARVRSAWAGRLMCGPSAIPTPHEQEAQVGSSRAASAKERSASSRLKA